MFVLCFFNILSTVSACLSAASNPQITPHLHYLPGAATTPRDLVQHLDPSSIHLVDLCSETKSEDTKVLLPVSSAFVGLIVVSLHLLSVLPPPLHFILNSNSLAHSTHPIAFVPSIHTLAPHAPHLHRPLSTSDDKLSIYLGQTTHCFRLR